MGILLTLILAHPISPFAKSASLSNRQFFCTSVTEDSSADTIRRASSHVIE